MLYFPLALYAISSCGVFADAALEATSPSETAGAFLTKLAAESDQTSSMPMSKTSNAMRLAIEYPQSEIELPNVGILTKLYEQHTAHHRIPKLALASTSASTAQPTPSPESRGSTDSGIDVVVEITLHAKNRRALQSPLVVTLDPLIMADSEAAATSESRTGSISSSDVTVWDSATPTSGDLVPTPTAVVPMSTATTNHHHRHHHHHHHGNQTRRQRRSATTYILPADEASQLSSHEAHKAKLEHLGQTALEIL
ncbi:hypothetical protein EV183_001939 [Coemansia sp. RSA 2336]|nr:hypothetical protein EV183_001939 [Coemansia sp. RSA 2336]